MGSERTTALRALIEAVEAEERRRRLADLVWKMTDDELFVAERVMGLSSPPRPLTHPHSVDAGEPFRWPSANPAECDECAAKPGSPILCDECLNRRGTPWSRWG